MTRQERTEYLEAVALRLNDSLFTCAEDCPNARFKAVSTELFRKLREAYRELNRREVRRKVAA